MKKITSAEILKISIENFLRNEDKSILNIYTIVEEDVFFLNKRDDENFGDDILNNFKYEILNKIKEVDSIQKLSTSEDCSKSLYEYDLKEEPYEFELIKKVKNSPSNIDNFSLENYSFTDIDAILIRIKTVNDEIILYKKNYPISVYKKDRFLIKEKDSRFQRVENDILSIDINFQLFYYEDKFYLLELEDLHKMLKIDGILKREAKKVIDIIKDRDIVEDVSLMNSEIENLTISRKLIKIGSSDILLNEDITNADIVRFTSKHGYFKENPLKVNKDKNKFILDTKKSIKTFLELLNDQLLYSELSGKEYNTLTKREVYLQKSI